MMHGRRGRLALAVVVGAGLALSMATAGSAAAGAQRGGAAVPAGPVLPAASGALASTPWSWFAPGGGGGPIPLSVDRRLGPLLWSGRSPFRDGHVLVGFRRGTPRRLERLLERRAGALRVRRAGTSVLLIVRRGSVLRTIRRLRRQHAVRFAEPDYVLQATGVPNDPSFGLQWALQNTGQTVNGSGGTANADERAVPAWSVTTGSSSIVVAVTDTGVEYTHPDLAGNMWSNPGGVGGCGAGTHGFNVLSGENGCDPMDTDTAYGGHGTHVAGIIGAVGNNGAGVSGVNWQTSIMAVKWLDSDSSGLTSDLLNALQAVITAKQAGVNVRVVNDSSTFVGTAFSQALSDEIDQLGANNILFVTAAGNTSQNDDTTPRYPCSYDRPTEICVAATDQNDQMPSWANWGPNSVDMAAPGNNIYSTLRGASYGIISGSSMSAAEVSGAAALILSAGNQTVSALKADILGNVDPLSSLSGRVRTGGRLDICKAMPGCTQGPPPPPGTFGKTTVGGSSDTALANRKRVNRYSVSGSVAVTKLSMYLQPTATSGTQQLEGVIYSDSGGAPGSLIAVSNQIGFSSTSAAGWYDLPFASPANLSAGNYWIGFISGGTSGVVGFRWDAVSGSRAYNANTFSAGPSNPFGSASTDSEQMSLYATYTSQAPPPPPGNTSPPTISGTAQVGQTLTAGNGVWTGSPMSYTYLWQRCDTTGNNCASTGVMTQTYAVTSADLGSTLVVDVTAKNGGGQTTAPSAPTATVTAASTATFGKTTIGANSDIALANRKRVNRYTLTASGTVQKLSIYLQPTSTTGSQVLEGLIYADSGGSPGSLIAVSNQLTFSNTSAAGWYDLTFGTPPHLAAGTYWIGFMSGATSYVIGFRWDSVSGSRAYNANVFTSGPSNPFGSVSTDGEQMSLYATYTPG